MCMYVQAVIVVQIEFGSDGKVSDTLSDLR